MKLSAFVTFNRWLSRGRGRPLIDGTSRQRPHEETIKTDVRLNSHLCPLALRYVIWIAKIKTTPTRICDDATRLHSGRSFLSGRVFLHLYYNSPYGHCLSLPHLCLWRLFLVFTDRILGRSLCEMSFKCST